MLSFSKIKGDGNLCSKVTTTAARKATQQVVMGQKKVQFTAVFGLLVPWTIGPRPLVPWTIGTMDHWYHCHGPLVPWTIGTTAMDHWSRGLLLPCILQSFISIRREIFELHCLVVGVPTYTLVLSNSTPKVTRCRPPRQR